LTDKAGKILVKCSGPVFGQNPSSYIELKLMEYCPPCDSSSSYRHSSSCPQSNHTSTTVKPTAVAPNHTLLVEWDVLQQIRDSFSTASNPPAMIHKKSHPDDKTPYDELELKAQLNCLADKMAGAYTAAHSEDDLSQVPRFPGNLAQLHMAAGTVTNKIACTIRNMRTEAPLWPR
jgi:hypothetical protein